MKANGFIEVSLGNCGSSGEEGDHLVVNGGQDKAGGDDGEEGKVQLV